MNGQNNSKQVLWVLVGSLSAFLFTIISSIILSRYLNKADYGTYRQVLYLYDTLLVIFTLGLPKAYSFFLPRVPASEARHVINKINYILSISGLFLAGFIFIGAEFIAEALKNEQLIKPLKCFAIVPAVMLPAMGLEDILATFKKAQWLAWYNIATKALMLIFVAAPVALLNRGGDDAIAGFVIASLVIFLLAMSLKYRPIKNIEAKKTNLSYKKIFSYAVPLMFAGFWGILIKSADAFFISHYFGIEVFADFSNGAIELPFVAMIISATSIVLAPLYSKKVFDNNPDSKKEIIRIWDSVFSKTIMLTYPLLIFFFCFSDALMIILYGEKYESAGDYFQIKLLVNFFTLIAYGPLILSIGGNRFYLQVHMYGAMIVIALQFLSVLLIQSPIAIVWISVICQIGRILVMLWFVATHFEVKLHQLVPWILIVKITIPSLIIAYSTKYSVASYLTELNLIFAFFVSGFVYLMAYGVWAYAAKINYLSIIMPLLKNRQ